MQTHPIITHHQARASYDLIISEGMFFDCSICLGILGSPYGSSLKSFQAAELGSWEALPYSAPSSWQADKSCTTHIPAAILRTPKQSS
jgi:hypothetical protein